MVLKYSFDFNTTGNIFADVLIYIQANTYNLFTYGIIAVFFFVLLYVFTNAINDKELSFNYALFATIILSVTVYYMGKYIDNTYSIESNFFSGTLLMTMIVTYIISFSIMRFNRNNLNE